MSKKDELLNTAEVEVVEQALDKASELEEDIKKDTKKAEKSEAKAAKKAARMAKNEGKLKNKNLLKRSTYTVVFALILIAVIILVNVLSTVIANRLPTTIDVTADSSNSLTESNIEFIKSVKNPVEIIVCATREGYIGSEMVNYAANTYYVQENSTPYNYFNQTITLIEQYPKYNSKIKISYVDPQSPEFDALESDSENTVNYGDIIVRCTREVEGKQTTLESILAFNKIYELYDASNGGVMYGMGYYVISSSNIESELSSAIYTVAASEKSGIALLTGHAKKGAADSLVEYLKGYNFDFLEVDGLLTEDALVDINTVVLVSPVSDLSANELKILDEFLNNGGKRGKSFLVFGSISSPVTPNLDQFMEEWGIRVKDGMAYETQSSYRYQDDILVFNKENDLTENVNSSEKICLSGNNVALEQAYEKSNSRTSHILMTTSPYAVLAPKGTKSGYTPPSTDKKGEMPIIMVTEDTSYDDSYNEVSSYVGYFASADFISADWFDYNDVGNMEYAVTIVNTISGRDGSSMYFLPKITGTTSMTVSETQKAAVRVVCLYLLPVLVLIGGILVWIWRKNR